MNTKKKTKPFVLVCYFLIPFLLVLAYKYFNKDTQAAYTTLSNTSTNSTIQAYEIPEKIDYIFDVKPILSDRCYLCHGPDDGTREGNLRLDTKKGAFAALSENPNHFAIVSGDTLASKLVERINTTDPIKIMPPKDSNLSLNDYEKKVLTKWIQQGAVWKDHWAFVLPIKSKVPNAKNDSLVSNEIDNFILEKLTQQGLNPSQKASKEKLIRRVYFDLTGLPPTLEEIDAFLNDTNTNSFEKVVDHLLNSTQYGEHMAASWLDIARYSDTHGYQDDLERTMWPWRDWVISAFNRNIPYDEFVKWQLAGDLLPNATLEQIVATGFNRNHKITQEGGVIDEEYRVEYVLDRTNTVSKSLLGLTMECAQCHDHKYDPISQKEYFGFYAFFNKVNEKGRMDYGEIPKPNVKITRKEIDEVLNFINMPDSIKQVQLMVMKDDAPKRKTYVLKRGAYDAHGDEVSFTTPKAVLPFTEKYEQNRLGLANWLFDEQNTLTARVAVNRLWQQIFGKGIVASSSDFGNQGALPSHPELLDWLAITYREEGWDTKKMVKRMVMSNTYQQTTKTNDALLEIDPNNKWLARSSRDKLTAEMIRDNALSVSGLLVEKVGGPSVKPYQPAGLWAETTSGQGLTKYIMDSGENLYRRSLYTFWKRTVPPPAMMTFDAATRDYCTVERQKTSTPLQALVMLNDPQLIEAANTLAVQVLQDDHLTDETRIETIFRKITSRKPDATEIENLLTFLKETESNYDSTKKIKIAATIATNDIAKEKIYAFGVLTSLIFNLDEAIVKG
ncbi:PSD1 and planctomycete cytochrome C domain-containing protein [Kordia sp.]|uniref:PSD1 and planctomycete cytochrome C domain-containing protein n=1 Tax=Kordia sp. TaxID=1965332 RepID=UPI003B5B27E2